MKEKSVIKVNLWAAIETLKMRSQEEDFGKKDVTCLRVLSSRWRTFFGGRSRTFLFPGLQK
jgi:hypothetical protein